MQENKLKLNFKRADFPDDFTFGTATSAYQIEGSSFGNAGRSHWDDFADTPGNVVRAENGSRGCNHYNMWQDDLDLVKNANLDAYRFSTSWARILPEGKGKVNQEGLDFYDKLVDGILERNLKPFLCLYHWELPSALSDLGGWRNRDIASWFADFSEVVINRIGDRVHTAATFNEPWCIAWLSHFLGHHAPGLTDVRAATRAMHHVLLAHGKSIQAMRSLGQDNLGIVLNFEHPQAIDESESAKQATKRFDGIYNRWFLGGALKGEYPEDIVEGLKIHMPENWQDDLQTIKAPLDWLGVNYYTRTLLADAPGTPFPSYTESKGDLPKTEMGWEIYPEGLYSFLTRIHKEYTKGLPIFVTENGLALPDTIEDGAVYDPIRTEFIDSHMQAVQKAISDGVPVKGYFVWSLLDNYEWALGYDKRFGIVHVDFDTFKRTPKETYWALKDALN